MHINNVLIDGLLPEMMETTFVAHKDLASVHSQMEEDTVNVACSEISVTMRTFVVGFKGMESFEMTTQHGFVDGLVMAAVGIAHIPIEKGNQNLYFYTKY